MSMDLEKFPSSESAKRMLRSVDSGGFYDNSYVGKWIFQIMGLEMDEAKQIIEELPYQAFPETPSNVIYPLARFASFRLIPFCLPCRSSHSSHAHIGNISINVLTRWN